MFGWSLVHCCELATNLNTKHCVHVFVCRCYAHALKLMPEVASLWNDLGLNYYRQSSLSCLTEDGQNSPSLLLEKAQQVYRTTLQLCFVSTRRWYFWYIFLRDSASFQCLKKAIMMDSENHSFWNALGVISMSKGNDALICE